MLIPKVNKTITFNTWNDTSALSIAIDAIDKAIRELPHINSSQLNNLNLKQLVIADGSVDPFKSIRKKLQNICKVYYDKN